MCVVSPCVPVTQISAKQPLAILLHLEPTSCSNVGLVWF